MIESPVCCLSEGSSGLDTLVVHAVNDECSPLVYQGPSYEVVSSMKKTIL